MEHMGWGLQMTVLGMGLVFSLLALLWLVLKLVLQFDKAEVEFEEHEAAAHAAEEAAAPAEAVAKEVPADLAAAMVIATIEHKKALISEGKVFVRGLTAEVLAAITVATMKHKLALTGPAMKPARTFWPGTEPSRWVTNGRFRQGNTWGMRHR